MVYLLLLLVVMINDTSELTNDDEF